jgi:hypothetical protein
MFFDGFAWLILSGVDTLYTSPLGRGTPRHTAIAETALDAIESQKAIE